MQYEDILYRAEAGVGHITINRPNVMNAFRGKTCDEMIDALHRAGMTVVAVCQLIIWLVHASVAPICDKGHYHI